MANTRLRYLHILFSKMIFTDQHHFCGFRCMKWGNRMYKKRLGLITTTLSNTILDEAVCQTKVLEVKTLLLRLRQRWKIFSVVLNWIIVVYCWAFFGWPHIRGQWLYFRLSSQSPLQFILSWMGWVQGSVQAGPILFTKTWEDSVGAFPPVESNRVTLIWLPSLAVLSCTWDGPPLQWGHIIPALPPSCSDIAWLQPTCHEPVSPRK